MLFEIRKHEVTYILLAALHIFQLFMSVCVSVCRCWALALFGGDSETGFDQNTTYSIFSISITLTDEGFQNFYQVKTIPHFYSLLLVFFLLWIHGNSSSKLHT